MSNTQLDNLVNNPDPVPGLKHLLTLKSEGSAEYVLILKTVDEIARLRAEFRECAAQNEDWTLQTR